MSVHHRPVELVGVEVLGQSTSSATFHVKRYSQVLCGTSTAYCADIDPYEPCMYEWSSKPLGRTVSVRIMRTGVNLTEIRCSLRSDGALTAASIKVDLYAIIDA